mmetsp:Transcript_68652/g.95133  ORF Transcript_68652/g.95133 Transcript_68652/m.95133 type:complete len:193 (+) Transcript_68652:1759-2337(+)
MAEAFANLSAALPGQCPEMSREGRRATGRHRSAIILLATMAIGNRANAITDFAIAPTAIMGTGTATGALHIVIIYIATLDLLRNASIAKMGSSAPALPSAMSTPNSKRLRPIARPLRGSRRLAQTRVATLLDVVFRQEACVLRTDAQPLLARACVKERAAVAAVTIYVSFWNLCFDRHSMIYRRVIRPDVIT